MVVRKLSTREREVAVLVAKGKKDVEIATLLFISRRRVGELIFNIKEKWEITSRVEIGIGVYHFGWLHSQEERSMEHAAPIPFYATDHYREVRI
ncbi:helix-turn-helix transcriptional regulator [Microbacterium sp. APC 3898]|uniref:response regulator transcription factor n=1 Tax=Planococcus TaxID=1372 RepID=UPI001CD83DF9|nr:MULTISPECIES: helix-turn-helix transcriptional regulator [Terrabacteria group]MDN3499683.1 helix-turn-helix transcriptional regulator [Microbacterium sp. APC 3898]